MPTVLRTKLFIPQQPEATLSRPRLLQKLDAGLSRKLSVIAAPPGYGKTTLVTSWLKQLESTDQPPQAVWLSLDERDDNLLRFFNYFVSALHPIDEAFATLRDNYQQSEPDRQATESLLIDILNQIAEFSSQIIFVLDDFHEIRAPEIHDALAFWIDHQPPNFHLVLTSRSEPELPIPRLRVRRQITEIDLTDLRFTQQETADFLNHHMALNLSADDIAQLDNLTEGWVASLQLAALSLQNQSDTTPFIQTFKGTNRYIVDYLVHEVLEHQPSHVRDFLLQTSILERLNAELCAAVTGDSGSAALLEQLDHSRLFLIPLDNGRNWYRYHHLFADCLRAELAHHSSHNLATYHDRASRWLETHGFLTEAIDHAFTANNMQLAADIIGRNGRVMVSQQGELAMLRQWIAKLPKNIIQNSPQLLILQAWLRIDLYLDEGQDIDDLLIQATQLIKANDKRSPQIPPEVIRDLETEVALAWANQERLRGNIESAIELSERALEVSKRAANPFLRIGGRGSLASVYFLAGKIDKFLEFDTILYGIDQQTKIPYARYIFISHLIDAWRLNGQLASATQIMHRIDKQYQQQKNSVGAAILTVSWCEILREQDQLDQAVSRILTALDILRPLRSMALFVQTGTITAAHIYQAMGQPETAIAMLQKVGKTHPLGKMGNPAARLKATEAIINLKQGNLAVAKDWASSCNLAVDDTLAFGHEIDHLALGRIWLTDGDYGAAQHILEKLEKNAQIDGRKARLIEIYIMQALVQSGWGRKEDALTRLGQALDLASSGGFVRMVVDYGSAIVPLLKQMAGRGLFVTYIQTLMPLFDIQTPPSAPISISPTPAVAREPLLNPLTDRELATLRYLATNLTIPEIAEQMVVAPSTIRTYVKRIYSKLDVHNRIEAVNRARLLGLVS